MQIQVLNHSSYPSNDTASALRDQAACGVDWCVIGDSLWQDEIAGLAAQLSGVRLGESTPVPFRDKACRVLRIQSRLRRRAQPLLAAYSQLVEVTGRPLAISLTGPYTLSRLARLETTAYRDVNSVADDLSQHLAEEIRSVVAAGARLIQISEPWILHEPGDVRVLRDLIEPLQDAVEPHATLLCSTYGGEVRELFAHLNSLPGAAVGLDCVAAPEMIDDLAATGSGKPVALGLVGLGEDPTADELARQVERATRRYVHDKLYLQPACGLGSLSPTRARAKLELLSTVRSLLDC